VVVSLLLALAPLGAQASQPAAAPAKKTITAPKPQQEKLRGIPLWLLLGGLGTAALILAASNHDQKAEQKTSQSP
jgi:hypothetical protein